jgi:copper chaperone CopZ
MKKSILILSLAVLTAVFFTACSSNEETSSNDNEVSNNSELAEADFKVFGNCGMCEKRIETAALGVEGVESADWDKVTKMMKVTYASGVNIHTVHQAIADVGHDTEGHKASDDVYSNLPECCLYRDGDGGHTH